MSTDKKPTTRTGCNEGLRNAMTERQTHLNAIHDAKYAIADIEHTMKKELIRQRRPECLKIDWRAVNRALNY